MSWIRLANRCILPKPGTRPPPTPPAERSQAEVFKALLPSSPPAPLCAFLALYPEPEAEGSGCASISSAHEPSAAMCEFHLSMSHTVGGECVHWSARKSPSAIFSTFFLGAANIRQPLSPVRPARKCCVPSWPISTTADSCRRFSPPQDARARVCVPMIAVFVTGRGARSGVGSRNGYS